MAKHYNKIIDNKMDKAIQALNNSGIVSFPTETVYGLGANAEDAIAIKKVFAAKERPTNHPLIIHIAHHSKIDYWATDISDDARKLSQLFWPGPLTLILKKQDKVLPEVTGGQDTVALRVPRHPIALSLLRYFNGLVGPSANKYGHVSPTCPEHVIDDLGEEVDYVINGGPCSLGIESTVVNCTGSELEILREGSITAAHLSQVLGKSIKCKQNLTINSPGDKESHYSPTKPVVVLPTSALLPTLTKLQALNKKYAVLSFVEQEQEYKDLAVVQWLKSPSSSYAYARELYSNLRNLDKLAIDCIVIEQIPDSLSWSAVADRLKRASANSKHYLKSLDIC